MAKIIQITENGDIELMDEINYVLLSSFDLERIDDLRFEREASRRRGRIKDANDQT